MATCRRDRIQRSANEVAFLLWWFHWVFLFFNNVRTKERKRERERETKPTKKQKMVTKHECVRGQSIHIRSFKVRVEIDHAKLDRLPNLIAELTQCHNLGDFQV